jgi:hypothetical protein
MARDETTGLTMQVTVQVPAVLQVVPEFGDPAPLTAEMLHKLGWASADSIWEKMRALFACVGADIEDAHADAAANLEHLVRYLLFYDFQPDESTRALFAQLLSALNVDGDMPPAMVLVGSGLEKVAVGPFPSDAAALEFVDDVSADSEVRPMTVYHQMVSPAEFRAQSAPD